MCGQAVAALSLAQQSPLQRLTQFAPARYVNTAIALFLFTFSQMLNVTFTYLNVRAPSAYHS